MHDDRGSIRPGQRRLPPTTVELDEFQDPAERYNATTRNLYNQTRSSGDRDYGEQQHMLLPTSVGPVRPTLPKVIKADRNIDVFVDS